MKHEAKLFTPYRFHYGNNHAHYIPLRQIRIMDGSPEYEAIKLGSNLMLDVFMLDGWTSEVEWEDFPIHLGNIIRFIFEGEK